jgi:hypothetical protein
MDTPQTPQKYIRTFAGDMETLKGGGSPELVPFGVPKEVPVPAPVVPVSEPTPPREEVPFVEETIPTVQKGIPAKTYAGDFSDRVKETGASTTTILATEQDAHVSVPIADAEPEADQKSNRIYAIAGGVLFLLALGGAYFAYSRYTAISLPVPLLPSTEAPIVVEERADVSGMGKELLQQIQQSVARPLASGKVRLLSLSSATSTSIFSSLPLSAPGGLVRNIEPAQSIAGVINVGETSPFFILRVASFSDTFSGMLQWESRMPGDVKELFPPRPAIVVPVATSTATTTTTFGPPPVASPTFVDKSVANHDVRVLLDADKREILVYGYWNQRTLVIARDSASFTELLRRLASSRVYR